MLNSRFKAILQKLYFFAHKTYIRDVLDMLFFVVFDLLEFTFFWLSSLHFILKYFYNNSKISRVFFALFIHYSFFFLLFQWWFKNTPHKHVILIRKLNFLLLLLLLPLVFIFLFLREFKSWQIFIDFFSSLLLLPSCSCLDFFR